MFLGKTIYSYSTPLHPGAYIGAVELSGKPDEMLGEEGGGGGVLTLQWLTSHPGESSNTLSCFMLLRNQDKLHLGEPIVQTLSLTL